MSELPSLDERAIRARVGDQSFDRGRAYARKGMIFDARREDRRLRARCRGSSGGPYRVEATLGSRGIVEANCSCPVGDGGYCKHVAALLLTWRAQPATFRESAGVDSSLEGRSKEELIALVKQMLRQQPDLERLLETPLPARGKRGRPPDPSVYRRQAAAVFEGEWQGWGAEAGIADERGAIVEIGDGFRAQGDHESAAAVYQGVLAETIEHYDELNGDGEMSDPIVDCVEGLGECLGGATDPTARGAILQALFDVLYFDLGCGGVGLSDGVPDAVAQHATVDERRTFAGWVREAAPQGSGDDDTSWRRQAYGEILIALEGEELDDETFLARCREMGLRHDLVDRLLALGRTEEAVGEAERASDYELLGLLELFAANGQGDVTERLVLDRLGPSTDPRLPAWLKVRYLAEGDRAAALDMAERVFRARPGLDGYRELRELAGGLERWDALRPKVMSFLRQKEMVGLLLRVHLLEAEIEQALSLLAASRDRVQYEYGIELEVARAAEASHPRAALKIYQEYAQRFIDQRIRSSYAEASRLLARVRALYAEVGETDAWERYVGELRDRHRMLRALKEEMAAAGL